MRRFAFPMLLVVLALGAWVSSFLEHTVVLGHLNGVAPDGDVETYTADFHGRVQGNLRWVGSVLLVVALGMVIVGGKGGGHRRQGAGPDAADLGLVAGAREVIARYAKRTSTAHKAMVAIILLVAAGLRGWMLFAPITYDEAFTHTYYASRPWYVAVSDYSYANNHILHTLLVKWSTAVFGTGLVSLRLPAFLAGMAAMPLFYLFVRAMFNRYIALMALALVASNGSLIEYGALARGYSLAWFFFTLALVVGRHYAKTNERNAAIAMGGVCALGLWSVPTTVFAVAAVYIWLFLYTVMRNGGLPPARVRTLVLSLAVCIGGSLLLYLPALTVHGAGQLLHPDTLPQQSRAEFYTNHADHALALWAYLVDPYPRWFVWAAVAGFFVAAYFSAKYRMLVAALALGSVPLVLLLGQVPPARAWLYILFVLHISTAVSLFYLLKFLQEKVFTGLGKRLRTAWAAFALLATATTAMPVVMHRVTRFPDAAMVADHLFEAAEPGDRVYVKFPLEAPVEFHAMAQGVDRVLFHVGPRQGHWAFAVVPKGDPQALQHLLWHHQAAELPFGPWEMVRECGGTGIFAARLRTGPASVPPVADAPGAGDTPH